jgi:hypothetical protein
VLCFCTHPRAPRWRSWVLRAFGVAYLLLGIIGLLAPEGFGIMPLGGAEMIIHFLTAIVFLVVGFMMPVEDVDARRTT